MAENNSSAPLKTAEGAAHCLPEPDAWRYTGGHGIYRYRGKRAGFASEYQILKPEPLYSAEQMRAYAAQAVAAQAAPAEGMPCGVCGAEEAFTGSCGGGRSNPRAHCFEHAALATTPTLPATEDSSAGDLAEPSPQALMALSTECMKLPGGQGMHYLNYAKAVLARWGAAPQAQPADALDAARLMFLMDETDGFVIVEKDKYDFAIECAVEAGREEPTAADELNGVRRLLDAAMAAAQEGGNAAKEA